MLSEMTESYVREVDGNIFTSEVRLELLKAVTETGKPFRFTASGSSMYPFIRDQDIITIGPLPADRLRPGDVVAFVQPDSGKLTVHRIVKNRRNFFQIRGDNREESDGMVPRVNILGTVTCVERDGRSITAGLGWEREPIAFLSRHGLLRRTSWVLTLPQRTGAAVLQKVHALTGCPRDDSRSRSGNPPVP